MCTIYGLWFIICSFTGFQQLHSKLPEFCLIFAWDTTEFPCCEHSKYQNILASTNPLQMTYPPHLLVNETILTETASTMIKLPEFCLNFWQNFKLPEDFWNCLSFAWVCRKSHFAWVLQSWWNPVLIDYTHSSKTWKSMRTCVTVSEWVIKFNGLSRTADSEVHIVHISRVIIACTLKSLSFPHIDNTQSTSYK